MKLFGWRKPKTEKDMIKLGAKVKDVITGFEGIATARVEYLTGCNQIGVTGETNKDGKYEIIYVDESRLEAKTVEKLVESLAAPTVKARHAIAGGPSIQIPERSHP